MKFTTYCDKGKREINEDFTASGFKGGIYCFVVADGFGKEGSGAVAAKLTAQTIIAEFERDPVLSSKALYSYISEAHKALLAKKSEKTEYDDMGSTIAVLMTDGTHALWANSGDTRIYIYNCSRICEVSEDHSVSFDKFAAGKIEYGDIRTDADSNKLRRALGDRLAWQPRVSDVFEISSGFSFLLCTDGFWKMILEEETENSLRFSLSSKSWLSKMLKKIAPRLKDGSDNLAAIAIKMQFSDRL